MLDIKLVVAKGNTQKEGIEFLETYASVFKYYTLRILLSIAASSNYTLVQFDVETAFLYREKKENLHMKQPNGFEDETRRVCKLIIGLYGLKQSPRA
jgi:hypothetical protein